MKKNLEEGKFEVWEKELGIQYLPDSEELKNAIQFGREFAKKVLGG
jgi:flavorubredoxin